MKDPKLYLAIDNCFASKRWCTPEEWCAVVERLGLSCIEASADNECDPLYCGEEYLGRWVEDVRKASERHNCRVVNLYSGHGTYATLGLCHFDMQVRDRMLHGWLEPMLKAAGQLNAGMGFFCHAFSQSSLLTEESYKRECEGLFDALAVVAEMSEKHHCASVGVEQMYSPQQYPWRIKDGRTLMREVKRRSHGRKFYLTIDTGHQFGQRKYLESKEEYLRASQEDSDTFEWLGQLGAYSPIIHLQQNDNTASQHHAFIKVYNDKGQIHPLPLLKALHKSFANADANDLPEPCDEIYLTLELFFGNACPASEILSQMEESVRWWRKSIPEDGLRLNELLESLMSK